MAVGTVVRRGSRATGRVGGRTATMSVPATGTRHGGVPYNRSQRAFPRKQPTRTQIPRARSSAPTQAVPAVAGASTPASGGRGKVRNAMKKVNSSFKDREIMGMKVSARTQKGILLGGAVAGGVMNRRGQGTSSGSQSIYRY